MLSRNSDIVEAGGYYGTIDTSGTNMASGKTMFAALSMYQFCRLRQDGDIVRLQLFVGSVTGLTSLKIGAWRKLGSNGNVYRPALSEDLKALVNVGTVDPVTLSTPMTGCREGDYLGPVAIHPTGMGSVFKRVGRTGAGLYTIVNPSPEPTSPTNWEGTILTTDFVVPIKAYMQAPHMVFIGDSLAAGGSNHKSFGDTTITLPYIVDRREGSPAFLLKMLAPELVYQNLGRGGETSTQIAARYAADCADLKPRYVYITMGANDEAAGMSVAQTLAEWDTVLALSAANGHKVIAAELPPSGNNSNAIMQAWDERDAGMRSRVLAIGGKVIRTKRVLGEFRAGGDAGNLWNWKTGMDYDSGDGTHPSPKGYAALMAEVARSLGWVRSGSHAAL